VLSLFSGAGGMDLGFVRAGFEVAWAGDIDADACDTHRRNLGGHVACEDVQAVNVFRLPPCDVVIGGPPCQGFSVAGQMAPNDSRKALIWDVVRVVQALRPRAFVLENVPHLAESLRWAMLRTRLLHAFTRLGYTVHLHLLDAQHFGVPQRRNRAFLIGTAKGLPPVLGISPTVDQLRTAGEVLRALPLPGWPGNEGECPARVVPAKQPWAWLRPSPYDGFLFNGAGRPVDLARPIQTLCASFGGNKTPVVDEDELRHGASPWVVEYHAHLQGGGAPLAEAPARLRRLTLTEAALFQGFPAGYAFTGSLASRWEQVGNAVPPALAEAVARALRPCVVPGTR
jgi:DNA (cytosine-5)-methyltransferase 1